MIKLTKIALSAVIFSVIATACYRMPTDDDYSLIPMTNNRDFTREKNEMMPAMGY